MRGVATIEFEQARIREALGQQIGDLLEGRRRPSPLHQQHRAVERADAIEVVPMSELRLELPPQRTSVLEPHRPLGQILRAYVGRTEAREACERDEVLFVDVIP